MIIDLRKNIGGSEEGYLPLLGYIVKEDSTLNDVYGNRTIWTNYSETNCQRSIDNLQPYLECDVKEIKEYVQSAISYYEQMKQSDGLKVNKNYLQIRKHALKNGPRICCYSN